MKLSIETSPMPRRTSVMFLIRPTVAAILLFPVWTRKWARRLTRRLKWRSTRRWARRWTRRLKRGVKEEVDKEAGEEVDQVMFLITSTVAAILPFPW